MAEQNALGRSECPIWIIAYLDSCTRSWKHTKDRLSHNLLTSLQMSSCQEIERFSKLPIYSIVVIFKSRRPWKLGYVTGASINSKKYHGEVMRRFRQIRIASQREMVHEISFPELQQVGLFPVQVHQIDRFEEEILIPYFHCCWGEMINLVMEDFRQSTAKKKVVFNWDQRCEQDSHIERSRDDIRRGQDALASWRRIPGAGFSNS